VCKGVACAAPFLTAARQGLFSMLSVAALTALCDRIYDANPTAKPNYSYKTSITVVLAVVAHWAAICLKEALTTAAKHILCVPKQISVTFFNL
jgi:molybdopterin/thiamine biosynthesis adenylyltransferase